VNWTQNIKNAITNIDELLETLEIQKKDLPATIDEIKEFPLRVPRSFVARMRKGDPHDPLLKQVLPLSLETKKTPGYCTDPLNEQQAANEAGFLHKYFGRVLLILTGVCGIHCRYCFRRHFPYAEYSLKSSQWESALNTIASNTDIKEVILSGGDPLTLADSKLKELACKLASISHVEFIRIHTRMPIIIPERINDELVDWFTGTRLKPVLVVHANHANEINGNVKAAMCRLKETGVTLLNQTVLLKGVNDSVKALRDLSYALFDSNILPYYLHLLDRIQGAAHFEIDEQKAKELYQELMNCLPGYLVPRMVREVPGAKAKVFVLGSSTE